MFSSLQEEAITTIINNWISSIFLSNSAFYQHGLFESISELSELLNNILDPCVS